MQVEKAYINWSGGKDAAMALFQLQQDKRLSIQQLVTHLDAETQRVSMHGLRRSLLEKQVENLGLPLKVVSLPGSASLTVYNSHMEQEIADFHSEGYTRSVFGDIYLEDLRKYREDQFRQTGIQPVFPLWGQDTLGLMKDFVDVGFKAITVCVNSRLLDRSFCGRLIDHDFLSALPATVDPAGENGEFHSFVFDGPIFQSPVEFYLGETRERVLFSPKGSNWDSRFWYCDLQERK